MGQLAFIKLFMLVSIPTDINDNRRHVHVFYRNGRHQHSVAKIWIEKMEKDVLKLLNLN